MGTSFESLYDYLVATTIEDYRLADLAKLDLESFQTFMRGFLTKATLEISTKIFSSLEYEYKTEIINDNNGLPKEVIRYYFKSNLEPLEQLILIKFMAIYWYEKSTDDIIAISARLGTKDAKDNNNQSDLKTKTARIKELRSDVYSDIRDLQMAHIDELVGFNDD